MRAKPGYISPVESLSPSAGRNTGAVPLHEGPEREDLPVILKRGLPEHLPSDPLLLVVSEGVFICLGTALPQDLTLGKPNQPVLLSPYIPLTRLCLIERQKSFTPKQIHI